MRTGRVESVWLERRGTQLTAAAPSGTQVLSVGFSGDFDEDGGQLLHVPSGVVYDYSSFDANAETITLASPLPVGESFDDGDALRVYPLADDAYAHVRLEDVASDEEPITARIDHALRGLLPEGQRETGAGEVATVENTGLEWVVRDVVGAGTVTIRANLESDTYEAGVSGWKLDIDGNSEFNEGSFRGSLVVTTPNGYKVHVQQGGLYPEVRFETPDGLNSAFVNVVDWAGGNTSAALGLNSGKYISTLSGSPTLYGRLFFADDVIQLSHVNSSQQAVASSLYLQQTYAALELRGGSGTYIGRLYVFTDGVYLLMADGASEGGIQVRANGAGRVVAGGLEQWNELNLQNGWAWTGVDWRPRYKHAVDEHMVKLIGGCSGGTTGNGTVLAALPASYIPDWDIRIPIMSNAGTNPRIVIRGTNGAGTPGNIELFGLSAGASISLDGCEYRLK